MTLDTGAADLELPPGPDGLALPGNSSGITQLKGWAVSGQCRYRLPR